MRFFVGLLLTSSVFALAWIDVGRCDAQTSAAPAVRAANDVDACKLKPIKVGTTKPAHQCGQYYLAGQPAAEDLAKWKALGVRTVINLRMPDETDWDERAAVEGQGMRYISVPFAGPDTLTDKKIRDALKALRTGRLSDQSLREQTKSDPSKAKPILLHCSSSNRVGAIWYGHRVLHDGLTREAALKEAKTAGLRTLGYLGPVDEYIDAAEARR